MKRIPKNRRSRQGSRAGRRPGSVAQFYAQPVRRQDAWTKTAHVLSQMRGSHVSLRRAALEFNVDPRTVVLLAGRDLRKTTSGRYKARSSDTVLRVLVIPTPRGLAEIATRDSDASTLVAEYWNAVQLFLDTGDETALRRFRGKSVLDATGRRVPLLTDLDELERLGSAGVLSFESVYARAS